jgi:dolichol-phosphate mannosyltransferase
VPITFTDRTTGESKMSTAIVREAVVRVLAWRWDEIRHGRPRAASMLTGRPHDVGV